MTEFHADDYGLFLEQSKRILECFEHGVLNGTSIIANGPELEECCNCLPMEGIALAVHLNLLQGTCLAPKEKVPLLVDQKGNFSVSFIRLLAVSLFPSKKREQYKQQIKTEYRAQIRRILPVLDSRGQPLRLDGHAHWHVLPVAFDALMELVDEDDLQVRYIRLPDEPIGLYLRNFFGILPFPAINIVKAFLLKLLVSRNRKKWGSLLKKMERMLFLGVMLSGHCDYRRMSLLLPKAEALAEQKGMGLEILAHPGSVSRAEDLARVTNKADLHFFTDRGRAVEAGAFLRLGGMKGGK